MSDHHQHPAAKAIATALTTCATAKLHIMVPANLEQSLHRGHPPSSAGIPRPTATPGTQLGFQGTTTRDWHR